LAEKMIAAQASRAQRLALADDVVVNDGDIAHLQEAVAELDARYRALAAAGVAR
jgi:dephospho-CoA kinase